MGNAVRMRLLGWGLIQSDRCPYKKRLGHKKRPQEACDRAAKGHHLQANERGLRRMQLCRHLDFGLLASRTVGNKCLWFRIPRLRCFVVKTWALGNSNFLLLCVCLWMTMKVCHEDWFGGYKQIWARNMESTVYWGSTVPDLNWSWQKWKII